MAFTDTLFPQMMSAGGGLNLGLMGMLMGIPGLMGMLFKDDPTKQFGRNMEGLERFFGPQAMTSGANQFYQAFRSSPAYTASKRGILQGGASLQNNLASSLGQRGLGTSGIGAVAGPLAGSATGGQIANLNSQTWQQAIEALFKSRGMQGSLAGGMQPKFTGSDFGAAGMDALSKYLMSYFQGRQQNRRGQ
jgi:hypothetical protein